MRTLKQSVGIRAPVEAVFEYVTAPAKMAEWLPSMVETRNIVGEGEGQQYEWTYKMMGMLFRGQTVVVEHVPNECAVFQSIGAIGSTWTMRVAPVDDGTLFSLDVEYDIPMPILGNLAERILVNRDSRNLGIAVENAKEIVEAQVE
jgi:uncharacterized protein YndB with AHSA1/START domain